MKLTTNEALEMFVEKRNYYMLDNFVFMFDTDCCSSIVRFSLRVLNDYLNGYDEECDQIYDLEIAVDGYDWNIVKLTVGGFDVTQDERLFEYYSKNIAHNACFEIYKIRQGNIPRLDVYKKEIEWI